MKLSKPIRKWLILTQYYPPEVGAPQIRLSSLAKELGRHGMQVEVLTALPNYPAGKIFPEFQGAQGRAARRAPIDGVPIRRTWIYAATGRSKWKRLANYFSFTFSSLFSALWGHRPDVMFVESQPLSLGIVAIAMKWLRGVPYIYNVPDLQIEVAKQMNFVRSRLFLRVALATENFFLRKSWKISTVTERFIEHFQQRGIRRDQLSFLPNGADTDFLRPLPPDPEMLTRWNLHGKKVILYVGTHAFYHGLDTLIEAASRLSSRLDIAFLLVGDGPERPRLIEMAKQMSLTNVIFGKSPYSEMDRLYSIAYASVATLRKIDVAQQMRLSKMFPSLSCGVPIIYSGVGESADLIEAHDVGMTVEPESPEQLADAIAKLVDDDELRHRLGQAGREFVLSDYAWSTIVTRWLQEIDAHD